MSKQQPWTNRSKSRTKMDNR